MNLKEDIKSITYLKTHPADVIEAVNRHHRPMVITQNGEAKVVVQDVGAYEATRKALLMLKFAVQGEAEIRAGRGVKHAEAIKRIQKKVSG